MNDYKMQQVQTDLEHKHLCENTKNRIYLSALRIQRKTVVKIIKQLQKIIIYIIKILVSFSVSCIAYSILEPIAYSERGYHAIGGEILPVIATFFITLYVFALKPKGDKRKR